jgi:hypothetical protein
VSSHEHESSPEWIEDEEAVDATLRDVVVPLEGPDDSRDGDRDGEGEGSRRQGGAA